MLSESRPDRHVMIVSPRIDAIIPAAGELVAQSVIGIMPEELSLRRLYQREERTSDLQQS